MELQLHYPDSSSSAMKTCWYLYSETMELSIKISKIKQSFKRDPTRFPRNILLNYAVYNARLGYTQGMSDLLSPLLAELNDEQEAFWCFAGLMQRSVAVCTPTDVDMDRNLCYLRELLRMMVPSFYEHLSRHADALELLFCHRWILL